jgi:hypothetical protein
LDKMVLAGVVITVAGLIGLTYCIWQAFIARKSGLEGKALTARLQKLVAVNMAAFCVAAIGLAMVVVGILL